jgi:hypothetical protein
MARLIQDIQPRGPRRLTTATVENKLRQVHHATNIPRLAERSRQSVSSFDMLSPAISKPVETPFKTRSKQPTAIKSEQKDTSKTKLEPAKSKSRIYRRMLDFIQYPLIGLIAVGIAYSSSVGQILILLFLLVSLLKKVSSKYSFGTAILLLACIPFFQAIKESGISQNCAIYAYEMLVVGTLMAMIEIWRDKRKKNTPQLKQPKSA